MSILYLLLIGLAVVSAIMVPTFFYCWRKQNFGYVDAVWSFSVGGLALVFFWLSGSGAYLKHWIALALTLMWSIRLGSHILSRVRKEAEDGRYQEMRESWSENLKTKSFIFFQFQAVAASVMSAAPLAIFASSATFGSPSDWIAVSIALIAIIGETVADRQLAQFRSQASNKGKTCRIGLWSRTRHPNYFFEWLYWCSFPLLAFGTPLFWLALCSPLILLYLILKVTGIPPTERNALKSRGDDYRRYQAETNAFFPWPKKTSA